MTKRDSATANLVSLWDLGMASEHETGCAYDSDHEPDSPGASFRIY